MDTKSFRFFIIFILIIFFAAIAYIGFGIFHTISANTIILEDHFSTLTGNITSLVKNDSPLSASFAEQLENELSSDPYVNCLILSDKDSVFFAWPTDSTHLFMNETNGNPEILENSPSIKIFSSTIQLNSSNVITVTTALNTILKSEFYTICSRAFIIILAGTIFDFLLLLYVSLFSSKSKEMDQTLDEIEEEINTIAGKKNETTAESKNTQKNMADDDKTINAAKVKKGKKVADKNNIKQKDVEKHESKYQKAQNEQNSNSQEKGSNPSDDPAGLFSDKTGFGWESYLEPRLDAELIRAASNEMDLSLFVINIKGFDKESPVSKDICNSLLNFFKYKDMIFEYGESGFAGILVNIDIDGAMAASEVLYSDLISVFEKNSCDFEFGIGLTTRSLRLITGARLLKEATKAADKAMDEETLPIVAYRVNHEKSKQYLADETEKYVS